MIQFANSVQNGAIKGIVLQLGSLNTLISSVYIYALHPPFQHHLAKQSPMQLKFLFQG